MKLCAIYNVFDGLELLHGSISSIRKHVDCVLIVSQTQSNFGERDFGVYPIVENLVKSGIADVHIHYDPALTKTGAWNEANKRKIGVYWAKDNGYTHYLLIDCDEYYISDDFKRAKDEIGKFDVAASACKIQTYYKKPTLKFQHLDNYFVPFICKVPRQVKTVSKYPVYADPTRKIAYEGRFMEIEEHRLIMHHFSYVRNDIFKKLRNSSARKQINTETVIDDYVNAKAGYYVSGFNQTLVEAENIFNIHDYNEEGKNVSKRS